LIRSESLLLPVPGDLPHGLDLRAPNRHPDYTDLRSAWSTARKRTEGVDGPQLEDWSDVAQQAASILTNLSKDLEVACWLAEALVYTDGFAGLATGAEIIAGLVETFWTGLFPAPDPEEPGGDAIEARMEPLGRSVAEKNVYFLPAIHRIVLFTLDNGNAFILERCQAVESWSALPQPERAKKTVPASVGSLVWNDVRAAARTQRGAELSALRSDIDTALQRWRALVSVVSAKLGGKDRFSAQPIISALQTVLRLVTDLAPAEAEPMAVDVEAAGAEASADGLSTDGPKVAPGISDREQALRQLAEISAFFRRTEPFSPVAMTLDEAIRRARLDWLTWLGDALPDKNQRDALLLRLGLRPDSGNG